MMVVSGRERDARTNQGYAYGVSAFQSQRWSGLVIRPQRTVRRVDPMNRTGLHRLPFSVRALLVALTLLLASGTASLAGNRFILS